MLALQETQRTDRVQLQPVGFIDDDPSLLGRRFHGLPVLGDVTQLGRLIREHRLDGVLVPDRIAPDRLRATMQTCAAAGVEVYQFSTGVHALSSLGVPVGDRRAFVRTIVESA